LRYLAQRFEEGEVVQVNELLCKALCHNICVLIQSIDELGVPVTL
jgi:hypothetical protein